MRLTRVLLKESWRWRRKQIWRTRGYMVEPETVVPRVLKITNTKLHDPVDEYLKKPVVEYPDLPDLTPDYSQKVDPTQMEDYHVEPIYQYQHKQLLEGEKQALVLTKTTVISETSLPELSTCNVGKLSLPRQDELMQRYIMQGNIWNPTKEKLPKRPINPEIPGWKFKAEFGIPENQIVDIVLRGFFRLCEMAAIAHPEVKSSSRRLARDAYVAAFYHHQDKPIQIAGEQAYLLTSDAPLEPFASEEAVDESTLSQLPNLYPIAPTIDLVKVHNYTLDTVPNWQPEFKHVNPHTLFIKNTTLEDQTHVDTKAIMFMFAQCLARARQLYGEDHRGQLPSPVCTQCVVTNKADFHLYSYQLNTTDFSNSGGIKNMLWKDTQNALYRKILPKRAMLRNTKYEDYDGQVLQKLMGMYATGWQL